IGTGGSLRALAISILCLGVDILIFIPFVRLSNKVQHGLKEKGESLETK
ncbi:PTS sugar transporter subunit IIC, partial [Streptococcus thermophilus]